MTITINAHLPRSEIALFERALDKLQVEHGGYTWGNATASVLRQAVKPALHYARQHTRKRRGVLRRSLTVRTFKRRGDQPVAISMGYTFASGVIRNPHRVARVGQVLGHEYTNRRFPLGGQKVIEKSLERNEERIVREFTQFWRRWLDNYARRVRARNR